MDQEVYDEVMTRLSHLEDSAGVREFAMLLSFHYPDQGRALIESFNPTPVE